MMTMPASPFPLLVAALTVLIAGLITMTFGRRLPRNGDWIVAVGVIILLSVIGWEMAELKESHEGSNTWLTGWIWPREESGAITVGLIKDMLGLLMACLTGVVAAAGLVIVRSNGALAGHQRLDRLFASLAISTSGVALCWFSLTPWLALLGLAFVIFGGFLALGSRWQEPGEARAASRFGWERSWGMLFIVVGLCVLAGGRAPLSMIEPMQPGNAASDLLGSGLVVFGALALLQTFPFLGWLMTESETPSFARVVQGQVFPAWAVLSVLIRLEPQLRSAGILPALGWMSLVSVVLASVAGLLRNQWKQGLGTWTSAGFSMSIAALSFIGAPQALSIAIAVGLGASALAGFAAAIEVGGEKSKHHRQRAVWAKLGCGFAAAAGTGFVGFVSAGGGLSWLGHIWSQPALAAGSILSLFLFVFLGWKIAWMGIALKEFTQESWATLVSSYLLVLLALGLVWTGTVSGGALSGDPDRLLISLFSRMFATQAELFKDEATYVTASGLYWGCQLLAIILAWWTASKKADFWPALSHRVPRLSSFMGSGYGLDRLMARVGLLFKAMGRGSEWLVEGKIWGSWIPKIVAVGFQRGAWAVAALDAKVSWQLGGVLRSSVEVPAKLLQLIQNGDVQWYLFFAVASGIAVLVHFINS